ncbi:hypothetical protein Trydic_g4528 [Trypoxylus dichotomus]
MHICYFFSYGGNFCKRYGLHEIPHSTSLRTSHLENDITVPGASRCSHSSFFITSCDASGGGIVQSRTPGCGTTHLVTA